MLLWYWKLGFGIQQVQELMHVIEMCEPSGAIKTMDHVIAPRIKAAAMCPILLCQSCQLSHKNHKSLRFLIQSDSIVGGCFIM